MFYNPRLKPKGHAGVPTVFPMEKLLDLVIINLTMLR